MSFPTENGLDPETGECPPEHFCQKCQIHLGPQRQCLCTLKKEIRHMEITLLLTHVTAFIAGLIIGKLN